MLEWSKGAQMDVLSQTTSGAIKLLVGQEENEPWTCACPLNLVKIEA